MTSVIIVSFNTKDKLAKCLSCLDASKVEIIVVDNASHDGSAEMVHEMFPQVTLIPSDVNLGFSRANNVGLDRASGELVLFLNSDAYAQEDAVERLEAVFADDSVAAAGGKLLNLDGSLQESVAGPLTLWSVFLEQTYLDALARKFGRGYWRTTKLPQDRHSEVEQVMGACLMMRKHYEQRFDERFFLYCEDTELCARLIEHGKILYVPEAEFVHELGSSSIGNRWLAVARYNYGKELYFRIHSGLVASWMCWLMNRLGAVLRLLTGIVKPEKARIFWRVLWASKDQVNPLARKPR